MFNARQSRFAVRRVMHVAVALAIGAAVVSCSNVPQTQDEPSAQREPQAQPPPLVRRILLPRSFPIRSPLSCRASHCSGPETIFLMSLIRMV